MIGDEEMPKIIWKGIIKSEKDFPTADIPKNAKKLDSEEDMKKMQIKWKNINTMNSLIH